MPTIDEGDIPLTPATPYTSFALSSQDQERVTFIPPPAPAERRVPLRRQLAQLFERNVGMLLIGASQFFITCMSVSVKLLNGLDPPVPTFELVAVRMAITYVFSISYMYIQNIPHPFIGPPAVRHLLVIRGVSGFFGLFGLYYSLQYLSLSDATVLTFLAPTSTAVAGYLFLGESFSRRQMLAGIISLVGVVLIARPEAIFGPSSSIPTSATGGSEAVLAPAERGTSAERLGAVGVSLLGVLGATGAYTSLRAIGTRAHPLHALSVFSLWCVIVSTLGMVVFKVKIVVPERWEWGVLLVAIGIFGFCAQILLTMGLQRETASRGSLALYIQIVFATVMEQTFFHVSISPLSMIGTAIILTCAIYIALTKENKSPPTKRAYDDGEGDIEESALILEADDEENQGHGRPQKAQVESATKLEAA